MTRNVVTNDQMNVMNVVHPLQIIKNLSTQPSHSGLVECSALPPLFVLLPQPSTSNIVNISKCILHQFNPWLQKHHSRFTMPLVNFRTTTSGTTLFHRFILPTMHLSIHRYHPPPPLQCDIQRTHLCMFPVTYHLLSTEATTSLSWIISTTEYWNETIFRPKSLISL